MRQAATWEMIIPKPSRCGQMASNVALPMAGEAYCVVRAEEPVAWNAHIIPLKWWLVAQSYVPCWWSSEFFGASHLAKVCLMSKHFEISQRFDHQLQFTKSSSHFCGFFSLWTHPYITWCINIELPWKLCSCINYGHLWCRSLHSPAGLTVT